MTATATERNTLTTTLLADREAITASVLQVPALARAGLPIGLGDGTDRDAAERRAPGRHPVFHWG